VVRTASQYLDSGVNVVVFPEGTRTPAGSENHLFRRGAAHIALHSKVPVEMVFMGCDMGVLAKGQPWWDVGDRTVVYRVEYRGSIDAGGFSPAGASRKTAAARLTERMRKWVFGL
jgi:1-acyl-sn-glycerol-3-phosphate acyltransferase